jgi:hypothetical protein
MEFKVFHKTGEGEIEDRFRGSSTYEVGDANGVLTVNDDNGTKVTFGPAAWLRVVVPAEILEW